MSCECLCSVALPHDAMGCFECLIEVFPDHTHLFYNHDITRIADITRHRS